MSIEDKIKQINALYHKSQTEGLTEEEKELQAKLRREYIDNVKGNLKGQLENMSIKNPDGTITKVSSRKKTK